jgi:type 1 glutamine amidotransferase
MVTRPTRRRAHVIAGGFPPGSPAGHDHDYARLRILELLQQQDGVHTTVSGDFTDIEKWLPGTEFLVTYVAGPYADEDRNRFLREWIEAGGRWLALHGSSGGRAVRDPEHEGRRRMVKMPYHETLGGFFINHPPVRRFRVDVVDRDHPLTRGLPASFETIDEPYMVEMVEPPPCHVLMTAELGPDVSPPGSGFVYDRDTALQPDGKTRVIAYVRDVGQGGVVYTTLGHCHTPTTNSQRTVDTSVDPEGKPPLLLRTTWETEAFPALLRNAIEWGLRLHEEAPAAARA